MRLEGKIALVTGAASGIGQATVRRFVREGATVVATDVDERGLAETVSGLERATASPLDVSVSARVNEVFAETESRFGRLDVLVNSAGIGSPSPAMAELRGRGMVRVAEAAKRGEELSPKWDFIEHITDEDFARSIAVNLFGTFYCLRAAVPIMTRSGGGSIVNVSSVAALTGQPSPLYYPAGKAGVLGLTRAAAGELADRGIRVNAVAPGATDTPLFRMMPPAAREMVTQQAPLARVAPPDEIAHTILFLASDESAFYTGQTLSPSGGLHM